MPACDFAGLPPDDLGGTFLLLAETTHGFFPPDAALAMCQVLLESSCHSRRGEGRTAPGQVAIHQLVPFNDATGLSNMLIA